MPMRRWRGSCETDAPTASSFNWQSVDSSLTERAPYRQGLVSVPTGKWLMSFGVRRSVTPPSISKSYGTSCSRFTLSHCCVRMRWAVSTVNPRASVACALPIRMSARSLPITPRADRVLRAPPMSLTLREGSPTRSYVVLKLKPPCASRSASSEPAKNSSATLSKTRP
jgi:hypothetical protein